MNCCTPNCKNIAEYGFITNNKKRKDKAYLCKDCKLENMIYMKDKRLCSIDNCGDKAEYNIPESKDAIYCKNHYNKKTMVNIKSSFPKCIEINDDGNICGKMCTYGIDFHKPLACSKHGKDKGYIDVQHIRCQKCDKPNPSYAFVVNDNEEIKTSPTHCLSCAENGMINVIKPECIKCKNTPTFGYIGTTKALFCSEHREKNTEDVRHKKCTGIKKDSSKCTNRAFFNYYNKSPPIFCSDHKLPNMYNIYSNLCLYKENETLCLISASFNYKDNKKGIRCAEHALEGMINHSIVKCCYISNNIKCENNGYYYESTNKKELYCFDHKNDNMLKLNATFCSYIDINGIQCDTDPKYNYEGEKRGLYCKTHSLDNMVDVENSFCRYIDDNNIQCKHYPSFNYEDKKIRLYCGKHFLVNMVNLLYKPCKTHLCGNTVKKANSKYSDYCSRCFYFLYPDSPLVKNYKTKEYAVCEFIKENFQNIDLTFDKIIENGCSKRRPDILIDMGSHCIIVEVDENQHQTYDITCENKRLMEISQDLQHRPIVFIRFNPDNYITKDNKRIQSCWSVMKSGLVQITKKKEDEWKRRLNILKEKINFYIENTIDKTIEIIQLFYDEIDI